MGISKHPLWGFSVEQKYRDDAVDDFRYPGHNEMPWHNLDAGISASRAGERVAAARTKHVIVRAELNAESLINWRVPVAELLDVDRKLRICRDYASVVMNETIRAATTIDPRPEDYTVEIYMQFGLTGFCSTLQITSRLLMGSILQNSGTNIYTNVISDHLLKGVDELDLHRYDNDRMVATLVKEWETIHPEEKELMLLLLDVIDINIADVLEPLKPMLLAQILGTNEDAHMTQTCRNLLKRLLT